MCNIWKNKHSTDISPQELAFILAKPLFQKLKYVGISGGEPTLRKDLPLLVHAIATNNSVTDIGIITNGLDTKNVIKQILLSKDVCKNYNINFNIMISLDGLEEVHDKIRGKKNAFEKTTATIKYIRDKTDINLSIGCTIVKDNVWNIDYLLDFCRQEKLYTRFRIGEFIARLNNKTCVETIRNFNKKEKYQIALFFKKLELYYESNPSIKATYRNIRKMIFENKERSTVCPYSHLSAIALTSNGSLLFCSPQSTELGSCINQSPHEILQKNIEELHNIKRNACKNCIHDYHGPVSMGTTIEINQESFMRHHMSVLNSLKSSEADMIPIKKDTLKFNNPIIIGWYGTETIGDKAIIEHIIYSIRKLNPHATITIATLHPFVTLMTLEELKLKNISLVKTYSSDFIDKCTTSDAIIMGGGPLMGMEPLGFVLTAFTIGAQRNIPNIIWGCGIGPLIESKYIETVKRIVNLSSKILVRDSSSLEWIKKNTRYDNASCTFDPATGYVKRWKVRNKNILKHEIKDSKFFACFLRELTNEYALGMPDKDFAFFKIEFEAQLAKLVHYIQRNTGLSPYFLPMHTFVVGNDDRAFSRRFTNNYFKSKDFKIGDLIYSPDEILNIMSHHKLNICMRFHSVLFAQTISTSFIAIDYTGGGKINSFLNDSKKSNLLISRDEVKNNIWKNKLDNILQQYNLLRTKNAY
jgi:polysaccharide pyruvyl transferase WcaK-like protein/MoaA/NifB/PqqE/SkfB family radical SAM enzyme